MKNRIILVVLVVLVNLEILEVLENMKTTSLRYSQSITLESILSHFKDSFDSMYYQPTETVLESVLSALACAIQVKYKPVDNHKLNCPVARSAAERR